jgi:SAM-dependent methyltransferase
MFDKGKSRSLAKINAIFGGEATLEGIIDDLLVSRSHLNVLEIGVGYGRALLELAWRFRDHDVMFHGVNLKAKPPLEKREDFQRIAEHLEIIPLVDIPEFNCPQIYFYDATRLHFADESIDLLYSAVTIRFMARKVEFLEEVARVLRPGGRALLDISESNWNYPFSLAADDRVLTPFTNRFVLKYGSELIPLPDYVKLFEGDHFRFRFATDAKCVLDFAKLGPGRLSLYLDYNGKLSMSGYELPLRNSKGEVRSGFRSVYDIRPEFYHALFEKGFLSRDTLRTDIAIR